MAPKFIIEKSKSSFVRINNKNVSKFEKNAGLALVDLSRVANIPPVSNIPQVFLKNNQSDQSEANSHYQIKFGKNILNIKNILESNIYLQLQNKKLQEDLDKFRNLFKSKDKTLLYKLIERFE